MAISRTSHVMDTISAILFFGLPSSILACINADADPSSFNVLDYGAVSDATTDNSQAFLKAWQAACSANTSSPTVVVPRGYNFLVNPVLFSGPCTGNSINFWVSGEIMAPDSPSAWNGLDQSHWLAFSGVTGLSFGGSGTINGRGKGWWDQNCRDHPGLRGCTSLAPTAVKFLSCNKTSITDLHFVDSPQAHILIMGCESVYVNNLDIMAPGLSPNTDGIHIQSVQNLTISNSRIGTGDDCVSIGDYTSDVFISYVDCGPGHGVSIGSLGRGGNFVQVENIHVNNVNFTGTTNGARIKTWQVGKGYVRGVTFKNLKFKSVENPIIIDQSYCDRSTCTDQPTGVHISDVTFKGLVGTSSSAVAVNLGCSRSVACTNIVLESIQLRSNTTGEAVTSKCVNAHGFGAGVVEPVHCLV